MLGGIIDEGSIPTVISELEQMADEAPVVSMGAIYILKNELSSLEPSAIRRTVLFDASFDIPGLCLNRPFGEASLFQALSECAGDLWWWLTGRDIERFRDRCDRFFWEQMVPVITANFGELADPVMNTINEAIINYAEYSFGRWALRRRVHAHLFKTEGNLAYAIIRPSGTRIRSFDPLALRTREPGPRKRGWGHTLLMERALFLSFDHDPRKRGMMIVVGSE